MNHCFDVEVAEKYGLQEAIIIQNIQHWMAKNAANDRNMHDGKVWTYNSLNAWRQLFPYWSVSQLKRILSRMEENGILEKGNYNKSKYDRTTWYTLKPAELCIFRNRPIERTESSHRRDEIVPPIPDINHINNHIEEARVETPSESPPKRSPCPYNEIVNLYHKILPELPSIVVLTDKRKRALKARWGNGMYGMENWDLYFNHVRESKFLMGKVDPWGGRKQFIADFDFLIRESTTVKTQEGKYH